MATHEDDRSETPAKTPRKTPPSEPYFASDRGYLEHWRKVGARVEEIRRREVREHGPKPYDWRIVDSLLQLGFLHGDRNPSTGLIEWQKRIAAAHARRIGDEP